MANVLIIDDDLDVAETLAAMMTAQGHDVRVGYDGQEGLRLVLERVPDLALLDVEMPILSGPGLAYQLLVRNTGLENVPVVLLSAVVDLPDVAARVGTPYFLAKPYRYHQLIALVNRALSERLRPVPPAELVEPPAP